MIKLTKVELICDACNGTGVIEGDNIDPVFAQEALKGIGWMISCIGTLCPSCRLKAEQKLLNEILSESVEDDE